VPPLAGGLEELDRAGGIVERMRFQPLGAGVRPSGIGRPAELAGPLTSTGTGDVPGAGAG